jgi:replicative DNA helicase
MLLAALKYGPHCIDDAVDQTPSQRSAQRSDEQVVDIVCGRNLVRVGTKPEDAKRKRKRQQDENAVDRLGKPINRVKQALEKAFLRF